MKTLISATLALLLLSIWSIHSDHSQEETDPPLAIENVEKPEKTPQSLRSKPKSAKKHKAEPIQPSNIVQKKREVRGTKPADSTEAVVGPEHIPYEEEQAFVDSALAYIDKIAQIEGAAPLLDEILTELKDDHEQLVDYSAVATEDGSFELNDENMQALFQNPETSKKWMKLMALIADQMPRQAPGFDSTN